MEGKLLRAARLDDLQGRRHAMLFDKCLLCRGCLHVTISRSSLIWLVAVCNNVCD